MSNRKKDNDSTKSREQIQQDMDNFLKQGGKIQTIERGISGYEAAKGNRSITLGKH